MHPQTESASAVGAHPQQSSTGPGAQPTTTADNAPRPDCSAMLQFAITHDEIRVIAVLVMGQPRRVEQRWKRRTLNSWVLQSGPILWEAETDAISHPLADFLDRAGLPIGIAAMLPRQSGPAAAAAIATAASELAACRGDGAC
ncbi:MAG: hypothetical protein HZS22_07045 [Stenotrophomonas maltophilia]|nr:hypothetical protein [Stenotrophomonas maltophilia]